MTRWMIALLALGFAASACSSGKKAQKEEETAQAPTEVTQPKMGVVTSVDSQRLMLDSAEEPGDEEALFERTTRSVVMRDGSEVGWEDLHEGDAVRVTWDRGIFGPDRVAQVEVLTGSDADRVRQQVESGMEDDSDVYQPMQPREIDPGVGMPGGPTSPDGEMDPNAPDY